MNEVNLKLLLQLSTVALNKMFHSRSKSTKQSSDSEYSTTNNQRVER